jgi:uncharacterized protein YwqG
LLEKKQRLFIIKLGETLVNRGWDNLKQLIHATGFSEIQDYLLKHARPSIRLETQEVMDEGLLAIGQSKIGGRPDLPKTMDWAKVSKRDGLKSIPFIAQIDMEDVKGFDEEKLLPASGILYFFASPAYDLDTCKVFFYDGDKALLERKDFPDDIPPNPIQENGDRYNPCVISFVPEVNLPNLDANWVEPEYPEGKTWEDFYDLVNRSDYTRPSPPFSREVNRFLGYNYDVPADMQLDCQLIADTGSPYNASPEARAKANERKGDWQLLLQISSDSNAGMMWSDSGMICFYIRRQDLAVRNFDNVCLAFFTP